MSKSIEDQKKEFIKNIRDELVARKAPANVIEEIIKSTLANTTFNEG